MAGSGTPWETVGEINFLEAKRNFFQLHLFEIISVPSRFEWNLRRLRAGANSHYGL
jgi:hypothetical protein